MRAFLEAKMTVLGNRPDHLDQSLGVGLDHLRLEPLATLADRCNGAA
jgi:hypothetical protein